MSSCGHIRQLQKGNAGLIQRPPLPAKQLAYCGQEIQHRIETEDQGENDEQKGDPERTVAGLESAKTKTKQESHRNHHPAHLSLYRSLLNVRESECAQQGR
jgi:hypothetical protein